MSSKKHWLEKLVEDDPKFKDYEFKKLPGGFLERLGEAYEEKTISIDEITDSLEAGEIKRDDDLTVN